MITRRNRDRRHAAHLIAACSVFLAISTGSAHAGMPGPYLVVPGGRVDVQQAADRNESAVTPAGRWLAEDIGGGGVLDRLQTILELAADGTVSGTGGCNRMMGKAVISGETMSFSPIASTRMACTPAAMAQEAKFFKALEAVKTWRIDPMRRKLTLYDSHASPLVVLARI